MKNKINKKYLIESETTIKNKKKIYEIIDKSLKKSKGKGKEILKNVQISTSLIKDWATGEYRDVSKKTIIYLIAGLLYFLNPFDIIPDFILHFGYIDDISILGYIMAQFKTEIDNYRSYKLMKKEAINATQNKFRGALVGLSVGDALGTTLEFTEDMENEELHTEIIGLGFLNLEAGEWTDDTSMALCMAESLIRNNEFIIEDQMNNFLKWFEEGFMSPNNKCVDIGIGTSRALLMYKRTKDINCFQDENSQGNGSIMRLAPIPMFYHGNAIEISEKAALSSKLTHPASLCQESCRLLASIIEKGLQGNDKNSMLFNHDYKYLEITDFEVQSLGNGSYIDKAKEDINNSGFVLTTLEAALWAFYHTDSFEDAIVKAVNLCGDADTIGAVCGQIAGAYYGADAIPHRWLEKIKKLDLIIELADSLYSR